MEDIELKIDEAFKKTFLLPREKVVTDFFTDILNSKYKFREDTTDIKVLSVFYYASSPLSFIFVSPSYDYYDQDKTAQTPEIHLEDHALEDYNYIQVHQLCREVLDENNIDYSEHLDEYDELDSANYWENQFDLERDFLLHCWKNAKKETQSTIHAFLESSDGAGNTYNLNNGDKLDDDIDEYLQSKGIIIQKEI